MKNRVNYIVGLVGILLLFSIAIACQPKELSFETIGQGDNINYKDEKPAIIVIAKPEEVESLVQEILVEDADLSKQLHQIDYGKYFAVIALQGYKGSSGYRITVRRMIRAGNRVSVQAEFIEPAEESFHVWVFTSPYHIVVVEKQGRWANNIDFVLLNNTNISAEARHYIP